MKKKFTAELHSGHKQDALEVPFDPAKEWKIKPPQLWRGRRGFPVRAHVPDIAFDSSIVSRQRKFFLLIDREVGLSAGSTRGSRVPVTLEPAQG